MAASSSLRARTEFVDLLVEEHALFRRALVLFGRYAEHVVTGERHEPRLARTFLRFFRVFGARHHRETEEKILFPWLEAHGLPRDSGPLAVLHAEHDLGHELLDELARAARALRDAPGRTAARVRFHGLALRLAEHYTAHMDKEEDALFSLARECAGRSRRAVLPRVSSSVRGCAWISALEAEVADAWPSPKLSLYGLGTLRGFERLCRSALAAGLHQRADSGLERSKRARRPAEPTRVLTPAVRRSKDLSASRGRSSTPWSPLDARSRTTRH